MESMNAAANRGYCSTPLSSIPMFVLPNLMWREIPYARYLSSVISLFSDGEDLHHISVSVILRSMEESS